MSWSTRASITARSSLRQTRSKGWVIQVNSEIGTVAHLNVSAKSLAVRQRIAFIIRSLLASPPGLTGTLIVGVVILLALLSPVVAPRDPLARHLQSRFKPPGFADDTGLYVLGTDQLGRDIFS